MKYRTARDQDSVDTVPTPVHTERNSHESVGSTCLRTWRELETGPHMFTGTVIFCAMYMACLEAISEMCRYIYCTESICAAISCTVIAQSFGGSPQHFSIAGPVQTSSSPADMSNRLFALKVGFTHYVDVFTR